MGELPNGWLYYVPTCMEYTPEIKPYLHVGIVSVIWITDIVPGGDLMFEKAVELLGK